MADQFVTCDNSFHDHASLEEARACARKADREERRAEQALFDRESARLDESDFGLIAEDDF